MRQAIEIGIFSGPISRCEFSTGASLGTFLVYSYVMLLHQCWRWRSTAIPDGRESQGWPESIKCALPRHQVERNCVANVSFHIRFVDCAGKRFEKTCIGLHCIESLSFNPAKQEKKGRIKMRPFSRPP